jgi:hypothetical protein
VVPPISSRNSNPRGKGVWALGETGKKQGAQHLDALLLVVFLANQIEPVSVHDLGPGGNEVLHKLLLIVILSVDLDVGTKD